MSKTIGIVDYEMGNLLSVQKAFEYLGVNVVVSDKEDVLQQCDAIVLPGVGAFGDAMYHLTQKGLVDVVKNLASNKPLLGICLGMQLLFDKSYEFGEHKGLGLIEGDIIPIPSQQIRIPHMGWNQLEIKTQSPLLKDINNGDFVYFVHSYMAKVKNHENILATTNYGEEVTAIVGKGNVYGCQFHPEKSSTVGLNILKNFTEMLQGGNV